jgi:hypothetical protein
VKVQVGGMTRLVLVGVMEPALGVAVCVLDAVELAVGETVCVLDAVEPAVGETVCVLDAVGVLVAVGMMDGDPGNACPPWSPVMFIVALAKSTAGSFSRKV